MATQRLLTPKEKMRLTDSLTFMFDDLMKMQHKINNLRDEAIDIGKRHGRLHSLPMLSLELDGLYRKEQSARNAVKQVMKEFGL